MQKAVPKDGINGIDYVVEVPELFERHIGSYCLIIGKLESIKLIQNEHIFPQNRKKETRNGNP